MRLLYLSASGQMGGAERVLVDVLRLVRAARPSWTITVLAGQDGPLATEARIPADEVIVLPFPSDIARLGDSAAGRARSADGARLIGRAVVAGMSVAPY